MKAVTGLKVLTTLRVRFKPPTPPALWALRVYSSFMFVFGDCLMAAWLIDLFVIFISSIFNFF
jgi:hypothetical protein